MLHSPQETRFVQRQDAPLALVLTSTTSVFCFGARWQLLSSPSAACNNVRGPGAARVCAPIDTTHRCNLHQATISHFKRCCHTNVGHQPIGLQAAWNPPFACGQALPAAWKGPGAGQQTLPPPGLDGPPPFLPAMPPLARPQQLPQQQRLRRFRLRSGSPHHRQLEQLQTLPWLPPSSP